MISLQRARASCAGSLFVQPAARMAFMRGGAIFATQAQPVCSPTRSSILSGRHAIHHGIYMPFSQGSALRLNLSYTLLPRYLQQLGYATHAVRPAC